MRLLWPVTAVECGPRPGVYAVLQCPVVAAEVLRWRRDGEAWCSWRWGRRPARWPEAVPAATGRGDGR